MGSLCIFHVYNTKKRQNSLIYNVYVYIFDNVYNQQKGYIFIDHKRVDLLKNDYPSSHNKIKYLITT